ncbi:hypothetical protein B296_00015150, partial [Ensete ventricosum]
FALLQISPEDIRWEGGDPGIIIPHRSGQGTQGRGVKRTTGRGGSIPGAGKGRGSLKNQKKRDFPPSQNGISKKTTGDIEILDTNTLIKEVYVSRLSFLFSFCMQEHEQSLIDAIARLADASDGESGKYLAPSFCLILCMILSFVKYKAESV